MKSLFLAVAILFVTTVGSASTKEFRVLCSSDLSRSEVALNEQLANLQKESNVAEVSVSAPTVSNSSLMLVCVTATITHK